MQQEVDLSDFAQWTGEGRRNNRPYSARHINRALHELIDCGLVEVTKQYSGKVYKLICHRDKNVQTSDKNVQVLDKNVQNIACNPDGYVLSYIDTKTTNTPTHPPVVVVEKAFDPSEPEEHETPSEGSATKSIGEESSNEATNLGEDHFSAAAAEPPILAEVREAIAPAPLHPQLKQKVLSYSVEAIREAIAVVESQKRRGTAREPVALFVSALKREWVANRDESAPKTAASGFDAWFKLARSVRLVVASQMIDGIQYVMQVFPNGDMPTVEWEPLRAAYPIERLRRMADGLE